MKLVSIIVPVYNAEKYIGRCVESLRAQSYGELEIILVDDGSTDASGALCDGYAEEDSRIRVIRKRNEGQGIARNAALDSAHGDYVTFVDSDDWIEPCHVETLVREIERTGADIALGTLKTCDAEGREVHRPLQIAQGVYEGEELRERLLYPMIGADVDHPDDVQIDSSCCTNLYAMELIRAHGLRYPSEREAVAEDAFFNVEFLGVAGRAVVTDGSGYYYYSNTASTSRSFDRGRFERTLEFYRRMTENAERYGTERERATRSFLMKIRVAIRLAVCSDMKYKEKLAVLREMLGHETVKEALGAYPIEKYNIAIRLLSRCMRGQRIRTVYYLTRIREYAREKRVLGRVVWSLGLGRRDSRR